MLTRTRPSTTIPSTVGFASWVLHLLYRLSSKSTLSPDQTFPSLLKEGGRGVFVRKEVTQATISLLVCYTQLEESFTFSLRVEMLDECFDSNGGL